MYFKLYPNSELRARIPSSSPVRRAPERGHAALDNSRKVAIDYFPPPEICKYPSCPWPRRGYGGIPTPTEFSSRARKILSWAGGCFVPPEEGRSVFFTGTLPGSTKEAMDAFACQSAWVIHEFFTRLNRLTGELASNRLYEWVWEFQKRGALHFHCVFECRDRTEAASLIASFRGIWISVLKGAASRSGVDIFARPNGKSWARNEKKWQTVSEIVDRSVSAYLSKYLSKGHSREEGDERVYPTRWYGTSRKLLRELARRTISMITHDKFSVPFSAFSESDSGLVLELQSLCSKFYTYKDKFGGAVNFVFYFELDAVKKVEELMCGRRKDDQPKRAGSGASFFVCRQGRRAVRFKYVEMVLLNPRVFSSFHEYLVPRELEEFIRYKDDELCDYAVLEDVDVCGKKALMNAGFLFESIPTQESVAGIDGPEMPENEEFWGEQCELRYPGLPF